MRRQTKIKRELKFSETKFYFDNCPICRAVKKAEGGGKDLSFSKLRKAFGKSHKRNGLK